jgi:predicted phage-related endonuclease
MSGAQIIKPAEWHARRANNVGSSEVAALFDCQAAYQMSRYTLWHVKAGIVPPQDMDNPRTRAGTMLEDAIAAVVAHENGWTIERGEFCTDPTTPGMSCTPDWIIVDGPRPEGATGPGVLECKNLDYKVWKQSWTGGEPPAYTLLQLQHQCACTGYNWGVVGGFIGGNTARAYPYLARPKLIADIRRRVTEFWQSIKDGKPPPVDGSEGATYVLASLYPEVIDDAIDMTGSNEWPGDVAEFLSAGEDRREINARYDEAKNKIVAHLSGHKRGWGGGYSVNCSVTPAKEDRPARIGEIIKGRAEVRRYTAKIMEG